MSGSEVLNLVLTIVGSALVLSGLGWRMYKHLDDKIGKTSEKVIRLEERSKLEDNNRILQALSDQGASRRNP